jgi:extracellular solute-binding protein (family 7)
MLIGHHVNWQSRSMGTVRVRHAGSPRAGRQANRAMVRIIKAVDRAISGVGGGLPELISPTTKVAYRLDFYLVATNRAWWDKLPDDVRTSIKAALAVASKWNWQNTGKENLDAYVQLKQMGDEAVPSSREDPKK